MKSWDEFGSFKASFLKPLKEFLSEEEGEQLGYKQIEEGKNRRSQFTPQELKDFIIPYTTLEVNALVALMNRLNEYCLEASIFLKRFDGAGAIAASILEQYRVKQYYGTIPN